jgi:hypothetical protein
MYIYIIVVVVVVVVYKALTKLNGFDEISPVSVILLHR